MHILGDVIEVQFDRFRLLNRLKRVPPWPEVVGLEQKDLRRVADLRLVGCESKGVPVVFECHRHRQGDGLARLRVGGVQFKLQCKWVRLGAGRSDDIAVREIRCCGSCR